MPTVPSVSWLASKSAGKTQLCLYASSSLASIVKSSAVLQKGHPLKGTPVTVLSGILSVTSIVTGSIGLAKLINQRCEDGVDKSKEEEWAAQIFNSLLEISGGIFGLVTQILAFTQTPTIVVAIGTLFTVLYLLYALYAYEREIINGDEFFAAGLVSIGSIPIPEIPLAVSAATAIIGSLIFIKIATTALYGIIQKDAAERKEAVE